MHISCKLRPPYSEGRLWLKKASFANDDDDDDDSGVLGLFSIVQPAVMAHLQLATVLRSLNSAVSLPHAYDRVLAFQLAPS
jgi:hypothetical protein